MNRIVYILILAMLCAGGYFGWKETRARQERERQVEAEPRRPELPVAEEVQAPLVAQPASQTPEVVETVNEVVAEVVVGGVPAEISDKNRAAIESLDAGQHEEAIALFEECLEAVPEEPVFSANLAEALVRYAIALFDAEPQEALSRLERAIELAPDREELLPLRDRWREVVATQANYASDLSAHFELKYDGERDDLLTRGWITVLDVLEEAYGELGEFFDHYPVEAGRERFAVVLYERDDFDRVTGLGDWAGGAFDGTIRVPVADFHREKRRLKIVLRHELVHAFVAEVAPNVREVPGWLNEGLAQYLEPEFLNERDQAARRAAKRLAQGGEELFELTDLRETLAGWSDKSKIARAYDHSLAFTGFVQRYYGERVLVKMLKAAGEPNSSVGEGFRKATGVDLEAVATDFRASL